jgi:diacylglycerol kinase family enzyme
VLVFGEMTRMQMTKSIKQLYDATAARKSAIRIGTGSRVVINAQNTPPIEADGEIIGMPTATYTVLHRVVSILT